MAWLLVRHHVQCSEFGCKEMTPLGVFTSLSAAKAERARLNKLRKVEIERRAPGLIGNEYLRFTCGRGYVMGTHDDESALNYAGYGVPTFGIVPVTVDLEIKGLLLFEVASGG